MANYQNTGILFLAASVLIALILILSNAVSEVRNPDLIGAEFLVS